MDTETLSRPFGTSQAEQPKALAMSEQDGIADAYKLAAEIRTAAAAIAAKVRTRLPKILDGHGRSAYIRLVLDVVSTDGAGSMNLQAVVDEFRPQPKAGNGRKTRVGSVKSTRGNKDKA